MNCTKIATSLARAAACGALVLLAGCGDKDEKAADGAAAESATSDGAVAECDDATGICAIPSDAAPADSAGQSDMAEDEIFMPPAGDGPEAEPDLPPETVLATIGDKKITVAEADEELLKMFGGNGNIEQLRPILRNMRPQVVMNFVAKTLVENEIAARGVEASDAEIDAEIEKIIKANPLPEGATLEEVLARQGGTIEDFRKNIGLKIMVEKLVEEPSNAEMAEFYASHKEEFETPPSASARHILVMVDKDSTPEEKAEKKAKADDLLAKIREGADFAEVAKEHSDCPSKERGGDLGKFGRGAMVPEFDKAVFERPVGEIGDIVETEFGYHIIEVTDRDEGGMPPFDELKDRIANVLRGQAISKLFDDLRKKAEVEYHESIADLFKDEPEDDGAADDAADAVGEAADAVTDAAAEAGEAVATEAEAAGETAAEAAAEAGEAAQDKAAEAVDAVTDAAAEAGEAVAAEAEAAVETAADATTEAVEAVQDKAAEAADAVTDAAADAVKAAADAAEAE